MSCITEAPVHYDQYFQRNQDGTKGKWLAEGRFHFCTLRNTYVRGMKRPLVFRIAPKETIRERIEILEKLFRDWPGSTYEDQETWIKVEKDDWVLV